MTALAEKISLAINKAIEADKLVLPTLPEMALKVREVADDPNASIKSLAQTIGHDAALTARIIKVANSPIFRAPREIEDLNMALSRLGIQYTSNLAIGLAMEQMFQATSDLVDRRLREVWTHSSEIAGMCNILCKHCSNLRADQATLAGLVHQIGILPILSFAEKYPVLLKDSITLEKIIEEIQADLGVKILTAWEFPSELRQVPLNYKNYTRDIPSADYADFITVATLQSLASAGQTIEDLDYSTVKAFERLGLDPNIENAEAEDLSEEMQAAIALLQ